MVELVHRMAERVAEFVKEERGASLWEYALLIIIGLGIATVLFSLRTRIRQVFIAARDSLTW